MKQPFRFGAAYYPEHWPRTRWAEDARIMQEMGFNVVRMGEFAWSKLFPHEGAEIHAQWLDEAIELLSSHGIRTILGTPTATPPKHLFDKYRFGIINKQGIPYRFGSRKHGCVNHPDYLALCRDIVIKMGMHYKNNPYLLGFQIDNELGGDHSCECYCPHCAKTFRDYLQTRFKTIDAFNEAQGTVVWSQTYLSFDEIDPPMYTQTVPNPHIELEYKRFQAQSQTRFKNMQRAVLLDINPAWEICTNCFGDGAVTDNHALVQGDTYAALDDYPHLSLGEMLYNVHAMRCDMAYGYLGRRFMHMETQSGMPGAEILFPAPRPNDIPRLTLQTLAHGASGILYFRYRTCTVGAEQYWHGILQHDGRRGRLYHEVIRTHEYIRSAGDILGAKRKAPVAILHNNEIHWAFQIQPLMVNYSYYDHLQQYYDAFTRFGLGVAMTHAADDLSGYDVIVAPNYLFDDAGLARKLEALAQSGKTIIMDFRSGVKDEFNRAHAQGLPGAYSKLLGIAVTEYGVLLNTDNVNICYGESDDDAQSWYDSISLSGAQAIAHFRGDFIDGMPAVTRNRFGQGNAYYIATKVNNRTLTQLLSDICLSAGLCVLMLPEGVEHIQTENGAFLCNHTRKATECRLHGRTYALESGAFLFFDKDGQPT